VITPDTENANTTAHASSGGGGLTQPVMVVKPVITLTPASSGDDDSGGGGRLTDLDQTQSSRTQAENPGSHANNPSSPISTISWWASGLPMDSTVTVQDKSDGTHHTTEQQ
jgi:hypothetical protein